MRIGFNLRIKRIKVLDLYQVLCYLTQSWLLVNRGFLWVISYVLFFSEYIIFVIVPVIFQLGWLYPWFLPKFQPDILILESIAFYMFVKKMINESFFLFFSLFFCLFLLIRIKVFKILTFEQKRKHFQVEYFVFWLSNC